MAAGSDDFTRSCGYRDAFEIQCAHPLHVSGPQTSKEAPGLCQQWWHQHRMSGIWCFWREFWLSYDTKGNALIICNQEPSSAVSDKCQVLILESWLKMPYSGIWIIYLSVHVLLCAFGQWSYCGSMASIFFLVCGAMHPGIWVCKVCWVAWVLGQNILFRSQIPAAKVR